MPRMPKFDYRCPADLHHRVAIKAQRNGESIGAVIRRAFQEYVSPKATERKHPNRRATDEERARQSQQRSA